MMCKPDPLQAAFAKERSGTDGMCLCGSRSADIDALKPRLTLDAIEPAFLLCTWAA